VTLRMEVIISSETSALTRVTRRNIPEDGIPENIYASLISATLSLRNDSPNLFYLSLV
jgi:hypothetical protein